MKKNKSNGKFSQQHLKRLLIETKTDFRNLFEEMENGYALHEIITDETGEAVDYRFLSVNKAFEELTGLNRKKILGKTALEVLPGLEESWIKNYGKVALTGESLRFTNYSQNLKKHYEVKAYCPRKGYFAVIFNDITRYIIQNEELEKKNNELVKLNNEYVSLNEEYASLNEEYQAANEQLTASNRHLAEINQILQEGEEYYKSLSEILQYETTSMQQFLDFALHKIIAFTKSKIGYIYFYNSETGVFTNNSWSVETMKECAIKNPTTTYLLDNTGCWGDAVRFRKPVIINDYSLSHPRAKGLPEGHVTISKFLTIPVFVNNEIVAVAGLANKEEDYTTNDVRLITLLMDAAWKVVEKIRYREEILKAKQKAEESDRLKSAFLANMSHEIRTPLNGIIGFSTLLNKKNITPEKINRYSKTIIDSAQYLLRLVNDILDLSKIEVNQLVIKKEEFCVNELLAELHLFYQNYLQTINKGHIAFIYKQPKDKIMMYTDPLRLKQILDNLIGNAVKFTSNGQIEYGCEIMDGFAEFLVKDTGKGIAPDKIDAVFERFRQEDDETDTVYGGTGLGLAISKRLVDLLGGEIHVESEKGKGSEFRFKIPVS